MMNGLNIPFLSISIFSPVAGAFVLSLLPERFLHRIRLISVFLAIIPFAVWVGMLVQFRGVGGFEFAEFHRWIDFFQVSFWVGIDGMSLYLFGLTACLMPLVLLWQAPRERGLRSRVILFLILETSLLGSFAALDLFLFYLFMESGVVAFYFLIGLQDDSQKTSATQSFLFFNLIGSGALLFVMARLYVLAEGSLNLADLAAIPMAQELQKSLLIVFLLGIFFKTALVPFHLWLPRAVTTISTGKRVILLAVFIKLGFYVLWRYGFPLFPLGLKSLSSAMGILGLASLLYGGFLSLVSRRLYEVAIYWTISSMGLALYGFSLLNVRGAEGVLFHLIHHGIIICLILFVAEQAPPDRPTERYRPLWIGCGLIALLAAWGLPGTDGFVGIFLIVLNGFQQNGWSVAVLVLAWFLIGLSILRAIFLILLPSTEGLSSIEKGPWRRLVLAAPLLLLIFIGGIRPQIFLEPARGAFEKILEKVEVSVAPKL